MEEGVVGDEGIEEEVLVDDVRGELPGLVDLLFLDEGDEDVYGVDLELDIELDIGVENSFVEVATEENVEDFGVELELDEGVVLNDDEVVATKSLDNGLIEDGIGGILELSLLELYLDDGLDDEIGVEVVLDEVVVDPKDKGLKEDGVGGILEVSVDNLGLDDEIIVDFEEVCGVESAELDFIEDFRVCGGV